MATRKRSKTDIDARTKAVLCAQRAFDYKAQELVLLDVAKISSFADFFLICSGRSSRQVQGLADYLEESLRDMGLRPLGVEGRSEGHWVLMDYGDVIVHIFYEPSRRIYDLESLWSEAKAVDLSREGIVELAPTGQSA
ncbi:MAG TPA: ribosome silencing factor [Syntrophobacteraceae bacterium]|nr:ribosome silencing factor [Syntrophobacteraceae bacterium]